MTDPKKTGRKPLPPGEGKTARIEWRTTVELKAHAQTLAAAAGVSVSQWLDALVAKAKK